MANNNATTVYNNNESIYEVRVNGVTVTGRSSNSEANTIRDRLNRIFSDPDRDLDFITPSYANGQYVVCCPLVRRNQGHVTYFFSTTYSPADRKLYETTNWQDSSIVSQQSAILSIPNTATAPWNDALVIANLIRGAIELNFSDAIGTSYCRQLSKPTNLKNTSTLVSSSTICDYYGLPCQGTQPGQAEYPCPEFNMNVYNIFGPNTANNEVFHPQGLTCSLTSTNNWSTTYRNKFIKVTNLSNGKSIVVKVTDLSPAGKGVELSHRAWVAIGQPKGANSVSFAVMNQ